MDILDDTGVSKLSAKVFFKVTYSSLDYIRSIANLEEEMMAIGCWEALGTRPAAKHTQSNTSP